MANEKKNPLIGAFRTPVPDASPPPAPDPEKPTELPKATPDPKAAGAAVSAKSGEDKKPAEPPKQDAAPKDTGATVPVKSGEEKGPAEPSRDSNLRFVRISEIQPLPGTYVKDTPRGIAIGNPITIDLR